MAFKEEEIGNNFETGVKYLSFSTLKTKQTKIKIDYDQESLIIQRTNHKMHSFRSFGH